MSKKIKELDLGQITEETVEGWAEKYDKQGDGYYCRKCGAQIQATICYVSIHVKIFEPEHAGPGRVVRINYPYCPKCDGDPGLVRACYHMDLAPFSPVMINEGRG